MLKNFFLIICLSFALDSQKLGATEAVFHIQYTKEYDTLDEIAIRYFSLVKDRYKNQIIFYKKDLIRWNPHISNWKNLTNRRAIFVDTPNESETKYDALNRRWSFFLFYSAQYGSFNEQVNDQSASSSQTSPIALGLTSYYNLKDRKHALVSNIYAAYLTGSKIDGSVANANESISIPFELGISAYYQYTFNHSIPTLYAGFDREAFSSFNTTELLQGDALETRDNNLYLYTVGFIKNFDIKRKSLSVRASYARTFKSTTSSETTADAFEGSRIHLYLNYKASSNFSYNILFKRFDLTGPTKLVVNRYGVGVGYQFY